MEQAEIAKGGPCDGLARTMQVHDRQLRLQNPTTSPTSKVCVLDEAQQNTSVTVDFSAPQMRAQEWTVTVYDYINEEWTLVTDKVGCTEVPDWNQEACTDQNFGFCTR